MPVVLVWSKLDWPGLGQDCRPGQVCKPGQDCTPGQVFSSGQWKDQVRPLAGLRETGETARRVNSQQSMMVVGLAGMAAFIARQIWNTCHLTAQCALLSDCRVMSHFNLQCLPQQWLSKFGTET